MKNAITSYGSNGGMSFVGPDAVEVYAATVIASGLTMWAKHKMLPNRAYTPSAMMKRAAQITGKKFKARDYLGAADALREWARGTATAIRTVNEINDAAVEALK